VWIDNFSKLIPRVVPRNALEYFRSCLWTVTGFRPIINSTQDLKYNGKVALPEEFLDSAFINLLEEDFKEVEMVDMDQYLPSITKTFTRIPLADISRPAERQYHPPPFIPDSILKVNIGANVGFVQLLEDMLRESLLERHEEYKVVVADINIFNRFLKVLIIFEILILL
jgi:hypothetical protein